MKITFARKLYLVIIIAFFSHLNVNLSGQEIIRQTFLPIAWRSSVSDYHVSASGGQTITGTHQIDNVLTIAQGFQQPDELVSTGVFNNSSREILIFPNPANNNLYVQMQDQFESEITLEIYFLSSAKLTLQKKKIGQGNSFTKINIQQLPPGSFLIKLFDHNDLIIFSQLLLKL